MRTHPGVLILAAAALGLAGCSTPPTGLAWLPQPISNNAVTSVVAADGSWTAYSFMGITDPMDPATITPRAWALDSTARAWRRLADVPLDEGRARIAASAVAVQGRVFLIGGYSVMPDRSEVTDTRLLEFVAAENQWRDLGPVPVEVDDTVAAVWRDRWIVLVSGWHGPAGDNVSAVQLYDIESAEWIAATPLPGPGLFGHVGGIVGDSIIVCDGVFRDEQSQRFELSDRVWVGVLDPDNPADIAWTEQPAHPGWPTYRAAAATSNGRVVILGGTDNPYNISGTGYDGQPAWPLDQVLTWTPTEGWTVSAMLYAIPPTMDHRALAPTPNGLLIIGGMAEPGVATAAVRRVR